MNASTISRFVRSFVATLLVVAVAASALAQNKKKENQSDQAQKAIQKQKDIAKGLGEKAAGDPAVLQKQLDEARAALQAEKDRHASEIARLNGDLKTATDAGQNQKVKNTENAIEKEKNQHAKKVDNLQKAVDAAQAKLDAAK